MTLALIRTEVSIITFTLCATSFFFHLHFLVKYLFLIKIVQSPVTNIFVSYMFKKVLNWVFFCIFFLLTQKQIIILYYMKPNTVNKISLHWHLGCWLPVPIWWPCVSRVCPILILHSPGFSVQRRYSVLFTNGWIM